MKTQHQRFPKWKPILFFGFLLAFFRLDIYCLGDITSTISFLLLWYGLSLLKKAHPSFLWAYRCAILLLLVFAFGEVLAATPYANNIMIGTIQNIIMLVLLNYYGKGMQELSQNNGGALLPQGRYIFYEYLCFVFVRIAAIQWGSLFCIIFAAILLIVILIQLNKIHALVAETETREFSCPYSHPWLIMGTYVIGVLVMIVTLSYVTQLQRMQDYEKVEANSQEVVLEMEEKGIPKEVVQDISPTYAQGLENITRLIPYRSLGQEEHALKEYVGTSDNGTLYHLIWMDLDTWPYDGTIALNSEVFASQGNAITLEIEYGVLYEEDGVTYRKTDARAFPMNFLKGSHPRIYLYTKHSLPSEQLVDISTHIAYQKHWFQYPYSEFSMPNIVYDIQLLPFISHPYEQIFHSIQVDLLQ